jgi:hypothetical protein
MYVPRVVTGDMGVKGGRVEVGSRRKCGRWEVRLRL